MKAPGGYYDCTAVFQNRMAMFEYVFSTSYWLYADFAGHDNLGIAYVKTEEMRRDAEYQWKLHNCGEGMVCMESSKWRSYWVAGTAVNYMSNFLDVNITGSAFKLKIFCSSCQPTSGDTYDECKIYNVKTESWWYSNQHGFPKLAKDNFGDPTWFRWRIISPATKAYWRQVSHISNCQWTSSVRVSAVTFKTSIRNNLLSLETTGQKIAAGLYALKMLQLLPANKARYDWSTTDISELAEESTVKIEAGGTGKVLLPGWRWSLEQWVGEAGGTRIGTAMYRIRNIPC